MPDRKNRSIATPNKNMASLLAPSRAMLMLLLVVSVVSMMRPTAASPLCTSEQTTAFNAIEPAPDKCLVQDAQFEMCDDDCLAYHEHVLAQAPNCTIDSIDSEYEKETYQVEKCKSYRFMASAKYMPRESPGLRSCTLEESSSWEETTKEYTPFHGCYVGAIGSLQYCSADCLTLLEDTIAQAPQCAMQGQFSVGETAKYGLAECIRLTTGDLKGNKVLQTVVTADDTGANKSSSTKPPVGAWIVAGLVAFAVHVGTI